MTYNSETELKLLIEAIRIVRETNGNQINFEQLSLVYKGLRKVLDES